MSRSYWCVICGREIEGKPADDDDPDGPCIFTHDAINHPDNMRFDDEEATQ